MGRDELENDEQQYNEQENENDEQERKKDEQESENDRFAQWKTKDSEV
jgi:hypothetical protein